MIEVMKLKSCRLGGHKCKIFIEKIKNGDFGQVRYDVTKSGKKKNYEILIDPRQDKKWNAFNTVLHEGLHVVCPFLEEDTVRGVADDLTRLICQFYSIKLKRGVNVQLNRKSKSKRSKPQKRLPSTPQIHTDTQAEAQARS